MSLVLSLSEGIFDRLLLSIICELGIELEQERIESWGLLVPAHAEWKFALGLL